MKTFTHVFSFRSLGPFLSMFSHLPLQPPPDEDKLQELDYDVIMLTVGQDTSITGLVSVLSRSSW